jgi:hypothetical protein
MGKEAKIKSKPAQEPLSMLHSEIKEGHKNNLLNRQKSLPASGQVSARKNTEIFPPRIKTIASSSIFNG